MTLLPFFEWCEATAVGEAIRNSVWLFPLVEGIHLLGLAVVGGMVLLVDLRLLGLVLRRQTAADLARDAHPYLVAGLLVMVATGIPLFLSESIKCYYSGAFWVKMYALAAAMIFTFTIRRRVALAGVPGAGTRQGRLVGAVSIALWATVGWGGRWIGFS